MTGEEERKLITGGQEGTFWSDENIVYLCCGGGYMSIYSCQNSSTIHLKGCLTVCTLYLNKHIL